MKKSLLKSVFAAMFSLFALTICAQSNKGTLMYEITEASADDPQVGAQLEMMIGTETGVYFMDKRSLTKLSIMGGAITTDVHMAEDGEMNMLIEAMGQKMWVKSPKAEQEELAAEYGNQIDDMDIVYDRDDTKIIAGLNCYKMTATSPQDNNFSLTAYITEDIAVNAGIIRGVDIEQFKGTPLEYIVNQNGVQMSVIATSYSSDVDASVFELNTSGYTEMSLEQLMAMSGGQGF